MGNCTNPKTLGRVEVPFGLASGTYPRRVHAMLMTVATGHPSILKNPEPMVVFVGFGDSALNFEVRFFLADITSQLAVTNEIKFRIAETLGEEGIEVPFPQRDLNIRSMPPIEMVGPRPAPKKSGTNGKAARTRRKPPVEGNES